jgi:hypothetical protein
MNIDELRLILDGSAPLKAKPFEYRWILNNTQHLDPSFLPKQRLWHLVYGDDIPTCKVCDNPVKWDGAATFKNQKYRTYCSHSCQQNDPEIRQRKNRTEKSRYGEKLERRVEKMKATNREKYGHDFAIQNQTCKERKVDTCIQRYGVSNAIQHPNVQLTREQTNIERYGVKAPAQLSSVRDKMKLSVVDRYGCHPPQRHLSQETVDTLNDANKLTELHHVKNLSVTEISLKLGVTVSAVLRRFEQFNVPVLYTTTSTSVGEKQIVDFFQDHGVECQTSVRTIIPPKEIDLYIPEHNLAIEYNGLYWHSELNGKGRRYHLEKTLVAKERGIQLIHIFESDWRKKREIVESILLHKIQQTPRKIYARQTSIIQLSRANARTFFDANHIQGYRPAAVILGLEHNGEILAAMSFSKSRYSSHQYEMYRFCSLLRTNVVGAASKLFNFFVDNWSVESVITYADLRFGEGKAYHFLGFEYSHTSAPNYYYFKPGQLVMHSRLRFQKHKQPEVLEQFDPALSEWKNMVNNGYDRIWDCGNNVWQWKR